MLVRQPRAAEDKSMLSRNSSIRSIVVRNSFLAIIAILAISLITISAAGSNGAVFSFLGSVREFSGAQSPPVASIQANPVSTNRSAGRSWLLSEQNSSALLEPMNLSGQSWNINATMTNRANNSAFFLPPTDTALQFDGVNDYVTFGSAA